MGTFSFFGGELRKEVPYKYAPFDKEGEEKKQSLFNCFNLLELS
jgi:hypothetical protein